MKSIQQPEGQKWFTNIVGVQLDIGDQRFEIGCYANKVRAFRSGVEKDLEQVLQTDQIFSDMVKGEVHSVENLLKAFGTSDRKSICRTILAKGKTQLTEFERKAEQTRIIKEITSLICQWTVCPQTNLPYPAQLIEETLRNQLYYSPNGFPVSEQAAQVIKQIQQLVPLGLKPISFQIEIVNPEEKDDVMAAIAQANAKILEEENGVLFCEGSGETVGTLRECFKAKAIKTQLDVQKTFRLK